jgi:5'-3' exonuclease
MPDDHPILIIDARNLFIRAYSIFPTMSSNGYQMGGCIGFLKMLKKITEGLSPKSIYIVWEGGGSQRRRSIYPQYKLNRKPERLNRFYEQDIPDTQDNEKYQMVTLVEMMKSVPICQLYVSDCEADDVIAYLCENNFKNENKIIVSSDKDFYQLLDEKTKIYSLHKKRCLTKDEVFESYRILMSNFALAKSICGDPSDNIPGVPGCGFKTVAKKFPILSSTESLLLQDIFDYANSHINESNIYKKVVLYEKEIKRNWKLVLLNGHMLSAHQTFVIATQISTFVPKVDKMSFIKLLTKEGINDFDVENFFYVFNVINGIVHK